MMSNEIDARTTIPKLEFNGDIANWKRWKDKMKALGNQQGFAVAMDATKRPKVLGDDERETDAQVKVRMTWLSGNERLFDVLMWNCENDAYSQITESDDKRDGCLAWSRLCKYYEGRNAVAMAAIEAKLLEQRRLEMNGDINKYLNEFEDLRKQLEMMGGKPDKRLILTLIRRGLPASYEVLNYSLFEQEERSAADASGETKVDYEMSIEKIRSYGNDLQRRKNFMGEGGEKSFTAQTHVKNSNVPPGGFTCYNCAKTGHKSTDCPKQKKTCRTCGKEGHIEKFCHHFKKRGDEKAKAAVLSRNPLSDPVYAGEFEQAEEISDIPLVSHSQESTVCLVPDEKGYVVEDEPIPSEGVERAKAVRPSDVIEIGVDSMCSRHIFPNEDSFQDLQMVKRPEFVEVADGGKMRIVGRGTVKILLELESGVSVERSVPALYCPQSSAPLFSAGAAWETGIGIHAPTKKKPPYVELDEGRVPLRMEGRLFMMKCVIMPRMAEKAKAATVESPKTKLWHRRLGHPSGERIAILAKEGVIDLHKEKTGDQCFCEACTLGKMTKKGKPVRVDWSRDTQHGHVDCDLWGPTDVRSIDGGFQYALIVVERKTRLKRVFPLRSKEGVPAKLHDFEVEELHPYGHALRSVHSDRGGEFVGDVREYCKRKGIQFTTSAPNSPAENGLAERCWRSVSERTRCMMMDVKAPKGTWSLAMTTAAHLENRLPTKALGQKSPYEAMSGKKPDLSGMRVWGSAVYVHVEKKDRRKLDPKALEGRLVGYDRESGAYLVWMLGTRKFRVSRHVEINEMSMWSRGEERQTGGDVDIGLPIWSDVAQTPVVQIANGNGNEAVNVLPNQPIDAHLAPYDMDPVGPGEDGLIENLGGEEGEVAGNAGENVVIHPRILNSLKTHPNDYGLVRADEQILSQPGVHTRSGAGGGVPAGEIVMAISDEGMDDVRCMEFCSSVVESDEPKSHKDMLTRSDVAQWTAAEIEEFNALVERGTWELIPRSDVHRANVLTSKWTYKLKKTESGEVLRYKSRLVACGNRQRYGVDYSEVFAPVATHTALRMVLAYGTARGWKFEQADVVSAFLRGTLNETIYMTQPEGYEVYGPNGEQMVCKLLLPLYGLKQAAREYWQYYCGVMKSLGLEQGTSDVCLHFIRNRQGEVVLMVISHVDDLLLTGEDKMLAWIRETLSKKMELKWESHLHWLLGMKIDYDRKKGVLTISQEAFVNELLKEYGMENSKSVATPSVVERLSVEHCPDTEEKKAEMREKRYRQLVGSLLWLSLNTRPDITHAVQQLARFMSNPGMEHWLAAKRVLRYLKGTTTQGISYKKDGNVNVIGFSDADWGGDEVTYRSTTGYVFVWYGAAISWRSRLQRVVSLSTAEAEYVALSETSQEAVFIRRVLEDFGVVAGAILINEDNQSAIYIAKDSVFHPRTKHIGIRYHFTRELLVQGEIRLEYCRSAEMVADSMTKPLAKILHVKHACVMLGCKSLLIEGE